MTENYAHQLNHHLKTLILDSVYIPTGFMVMENHGLLILERISLDLCIFYDLAIPSPADPSIMLDWLLPVPAPTNGDSNLAAPRRPFSVSIYHVHFVNPGSVRTSLFCDYISLSQYGKRLLEYSIKLCVKIGPYDKSYVASKIWATETQE